MYVSFTSAFRQPGCGERARFDCICMPHRAGATIHQPSSILDDIARRDRASVPASFEPRTGRRDHSRRGVESDLAASIGLETDSPGAAGR